MKSWNGSAKTKAPTSISQIVKSETACPARKNYNRDQQDVSARTGLFLLQLKSLTIVGPAHYRKHAKLHTRVTLLALAKAYSNTEDMLSRHNLSDCCGTQHTGGSYLLAPSLL